MSNEAKDVTAVYEEARKAADEWIGSYSWTQQAGLPPDLNPVLLAIWVHGYVAGAQSKA